MERTKIEPQKCLIWNTWAETISSTRDGVQLRSPRAAGEYFITGSCLNQFSALTNQQRAVITTWLIEQRNYGTSCPEINTTNIMEIKFRPPLTVSARLDRMILWLFKNTVQLNVPIILKHSTLYPNAETDHLYNEINAVSEVTGNYEINTLLEFASANGFLKADQAGEAGSPQINVSLTLAGHIRAEELLSKLPLVKQAFVAMWFGQEMNDAYELGFKPAIEDAGYLPVRIDRKDHNNRIDDEIIAEIRRSRFVVADFTSDVFKKNEADGAEKVEAISRGGVYFEAGFAKGLGREVIWTARDDLIALVHFDTRQFNHITWATPEELRDKLSKRISATLGDGPLKKLK